MSLAGDLRDAVGVRATPGPKCSVCRVLEVIEGDDREALVWALSHEDIMSTKISQALQRDGHQVAPIAVQRHRRGECRGTRR